MFILGFIFGIGVMYALPQTLTLIEEKFNEDTPNVYINPFDD